ncbi:MAG: hypothetical protein ACR2HV_00585 [Acidimicrobiales bacterium]
MYDYVDGKVDWMAFGLPVEGDDGPFVGERVTALRTCDATGTVGQARRLLQDADSDVVVVTHEGLVVGDVDGEALAGSGDDRPVLEMLRPVPSTYRPSVPFPELAGPEPKRVLISTPDGRLLGEALVEPDHDHHDHDHEGHDHEGHDHEGHDHGDHDQDGSDLDRMTQEMEETMGAVAAHFGDREPPEEELRQFLRDRLVAEGRSVEEADRFMAELDDNP